MNAKAGPSSLNHSSSQDGKLSEAQSLLNLALSHKRKVDSTSRGSSSGKKYDTSKKAKVNVVPKADSTLKSDVLAKFRSFRQTSRQTNSIVPKTKIDLKQTVAVPDDSRLLKSSASAVQPMNAILCKEDECDLTASQLVDLRKQIASGEIDLIQFLKLGPQELVTLSKEKCTGSEVSQEESEAFEADDSQDMLDTQSVCSKHSVGSRDSMEHDENSAPEDPLATQINDDQQVYEEVIGEEIPCEAQSTPNLTCQEVQASERQIMVLDENVNIGGVNINLLDVQHLIHSENCCSPCRQTLLLIVEKLNVVLQELSKLTQGVQNAETSQVPILKKFRPEKYSLMPEFPLKTQLDLVSFNSLLDAKKDAVAQFMALISSVGGKTPGDEIRNILGKIIEDELADVCTWTVAKDTKNGEPKLVVGSYVIFEIISAMVITNWKGAKDKYGTEIVFKSEAATTTMQDWIRRSSTRINQKAEKAEQLQRRRAK